MPPPPDMATLRVFSRQGCHLCEQLLEELLPLIRDRMPLEVVDIAEDAELETRYGTRIPVLEFDGQLVCQYHLDREAVTELIRQYSPPQA